ncbi:hypothetical protein D3C83_139270 [compost metagenome]
MESWIAVAIRRIGVVSRCPVNRAHGYWTVNVPHDRGAIAVASIIVRCSRRGGSKGPCQGGANQECAFHGLISYP